MNQYLRRWELWLNGQKFIESQAGRDFRIVFDIDVSVNNAVAKADIRLYNLAEKSAIAQGAFVQLLAGYEGSCDTIFTGVVTNVFPEREGADICTRLMCRSGAAMDIRGSANVTHAESVTIVEVLNDLAKQWPLPLSIEADQFKDAQPMSSGYTVQGDIPTALDALARQFDFHWTQQMGRLIVTKPGMPRTTSTFEVNTFTGMVGIPEVSRGPGGMGVYVTTRLNPYIRVDSRINVTSRFSTYNTGNQYIVENEKDLTANGVYNVFRLMYEGDSHGDFWNLNIDGLKAGTAPVVNANVTTSNGTSLVWGAAVNADFRKAVREMAARQKLDANWYMAVMAFETGQKFKAYTPNAAGGSARGLIQFMPAVARELGTSSAALVIMSEVEQMKYVEKYFDKYRSKIKTLQDMYMAVLWPVATDKPDNFVLWTRDGQYATQYRANRHLDRTGDGIITKIEAAQPVFRMLEEGKKKSA